MFLLAQVVCCLNKFAYAATNSTVDRMLLIKGFVPQNPPEKEAVLTKNNHTHTHTPWFSPIPTAVGLPDDRSKKNICLFRNQIEFFPSSHFSEGIFGPSPLSVPGIIMRLFFFVCFLCQKTLRVKILHLLNDSATTMRALRLKKKNKTYRRLGIGVDDALQLGLEALARVDPGLVHADVRGICGIERKFIVIL